MFRVAPATPPQCGRLRGRFSGPTQPQLIPAAYAYPTAVETLSSRSVYGEERAEKAGLPSVVGDVGGAVVEVVDVWKRFTRGADDAE